MDKAPEQNKSKITGWADKDGSFKRQQSSFRDHIEVNGKFPPEKGELPSDSILRYSFLLMYRPRTIPPLRVFGLPMGASSFDREAVEGT